MKMLPASNPPHHSFLPASLTPSAIQYIQLYSSIKAQACSKLMICYYVDVCHSTSSLGLPISPRTIGPGYPRDPESTALKRTPPTIYFLPEQADVAQQVEQLTRNEQVS